MKNRNKGQISVYACAMLCVFLILIVTVLQGIRIWEGKAKCRQSLAGAVDSLKGDYQPDLFRRYHLFAIDKTYYGRGEGYLEERAIAYLDYNLNPGNSYYDYRVKDVILSDSNSLLEEELTGFKQQIQAYMKLKLPVHFAEVLLERLGQKEPEEELEEQWEDLASETEDSTFSIDDVGILDMEDIQTLGLEEELSVLGVTNEESITVDDLLGLNLIEEGYLTDPRKALDEIQDAGILYAVMPEHADEISKESIDMTKLPSAGYRSISQSGWKLPGQLEMIQNISGFSIDSLQIPSLGLPNDYSEDLYGVVYALDSFQYAGHMEVETDNYHALDYEVEYILAGKDSDYENLSEVAECLCMIRFIPNAAYALSDETMQKEALAVATLILAPFDLLPAAKPVSYVLLVCWAYGESLLDVKGLLKGEYVPLWKDKTTWQLSLNNIKELAQEEATGCQKEKGLNYEEYLMLMLCTMPDSELKYYRMLDVMQLNLQEQIPEFKIENCIYEFQLQTEIEEGNHVWYMETQGSYIEETE